MSNNNEPQKVSGHANHGLDELDKLNQEQLDELGITIDDIGLLLKTALQKDNPKLQDAAIKMLAIIRSRLPNN